jgi:hypothetical protein
MAECAGEDMVILGLTGSMGMGKSAVAGHLRALGIPVCDADAEVHKLYEGAAVPLIEAAFPGTTSDGKVDRHKLSAALLSDPTGFKRLEALIHPLVQEAERRFLHAAAVDGAALAVLEIPLLFETGGNVIGGIVMLLFRGISNSVGSAVTVLLGQGSQTCSSEISLTISGSNITGSEVKAATFERDTKI